MELLNQAEETWPQLPGLHAYRLELAETHPVLRVGVRGLPERGVALSEVAREAVRRGQRLQAESAFTPDRQNTWAGGVNAAIVEFLQAHAR